MKHIYIIKIFIIIGFGLLVFGYLTNISLAQETSEDDCSLKKESVFFMRSDNKITDYGLMSIDDLRTARDSFRSACEGKATDYVDGVYSKFLMTHIYRMFAHKYQLDGCKSIPVKGGVTISKVAQAWCDYMSGVSGSTGGSMSSIISHEIDEGTGKWPGRKRKNRGIGVDPKSRDCIYRSPISGTDASTVGLYNLVSNISPMIACINNSINYKTTAQGNIKRAKILSNIGVNIDTNVEQYIQNSKKTIDTQRDMLIQNNFKAYTNKYMDYRLSQIIDTMQSLITNMKNIAQKYQHVANTQS